jgi:hypothetical protein
LSSKDGDYYLNSTTGDVYQKVSGTWIKVGNIRGPKGDTGLGLYISHNAPAQPYAGMLWIQAQTIYLRDDSNTVWYQIYPTVGYTGNIKIGTGASAVTLHVSRGLITGYN